MYITATLQLTRGRPSCCTLMNIDLFDTSVLQCACLSISTRLTLSPRIHSYPISAVNMFACSLNDNPLRLLTSHAYHYSLVW
jgi:hypothetical protein